MARFRFGVSMSTASSSGEWQARARRAEQLGYSALLIPDHLTECLSPWTALAAAAAATERLRVGTFVLNNDFRHPVLVAREAATLDLLSGGRLELGLGAGHMRREYDEAGIGFDSAGVRVDRLGESLAIIKSLLAGDEVDYEGSHYRVRGHTIWPRLARRPPIIVGGNGDRCWRWPLARRTSSALSVSASAEAALHMTCRRSRPAASRPSWPWSGKVPAIACLRSS